MLGIGAIAHWQPRQVQRQFGTSLKLPRERASPYELISSGSNSRQDRELFAGQRTVPWTGLPAPQSFDDRVGRSRVLVDKPLHAAGPLVLGPPQRTRESN